MPYISNADFAARLVEVRDEAAAQERASIVKFLRDEALAYFEEFGDKVSQTVFLRAARRVEEFDPKVGV